jgi:hypothetical protein
MTSTKKPGSTTGGIHAPVTLPIKLTADAPVNGVTVAAAHRAKSKKPEGRDITEIQKQLYAIFDVAVLCQDIPQFRDSGALARTMIDLWHARQNHSKLPMDTDTLERVDQVLSDLQMHLFARGIGADWQTPTL